MPWANALKFSGVIPAIFGDNYDTENIGAYAYAPEQPAKDLGLPSRIVTVLMLGSLAGFAAGLFLNGWLALGFWICFSTSHFAFTMLVAHKWTGRGPWPDPADRRPRLHFMPHFWLTIRRFLLMHTALIITGLIFWLLAVISGIELFYLGILLLLPGFTPLLFGPFFTYVTLYWAQTYSRVGINDHPLTENAILTLIPKRIREDRDAFLMEWKRRWAEAKSERDRTHD